MMNKLINYFYAIIVIFFVCFTIYVLDSSRRSDNANHQIKPIETVIPINEIEVKSLENKEILYIPLVYVAPDKTKPEGVYYTYLFKKHVMVPFNLKSEKIDIESPWILAEYDNEFKTWYKYCQKNLCGDQVYVWNKNDNCFQVIPWTTCHYDYDGYGDYTETYLPKVMVKGRRVK